MRRTVVLSGVGLALAAFGLEMIDYRHAVRALSTELYVLIIAVAFAALGAVLARRLLPGAAPATSAAPAPELQAPGAYGISAREMEVLNEVVAGRTNKEIARLLDLSPHTVKTHLSNLYQKLGAARRTDAIAKARDLGIIA